MHLESGYLVAGLGPGSLLRFSPLKAPALRGVSGWILRRFEMTDVLCPRVALSDLPPPHWAIRNQLCYLRN